jgi:glycosyltransferase involved in cell wall biosynthesis
MRVTWITFLDPFVLNGGGELSQRAAILEGRARGHKINLTAFLGARPQRALRRLGILRSVDVDWNADLFVLADLRNYPEFPRRLPNELIDRVLATGRAAISQQAWVDVCPLDMPCGGNREACCSSCHRAWGNYLYSRAGIAIFVSPMQQRMIESVLDVPLPEAQIVLRPPIDAQRFRTLRQERDIDVLYVGTISRAKGYYQLLGRFGADRLTLVGRSTLSEPVEGTHLGAVPNEELPGIYNRARVFAHLPEWYEPMGRTVVEAALCGCELVLNDRVGVLSFPDSEWRDPEVVSRNGQRFWEDLEACVERLGAG